MHRILISLEQWPSNKGQHWVFPTIRNPFYIPTSSLNYSPTSLSLRLILTVRPRSLHQKPTTSLPSTPLRPVYIPIFTLSSRKSSYLSFKVRIQFLNQRPITSLRSAPHRLFKAYHNLLLHMWTTVPTYISIFFFK